MKHCQNNNTTDWVENMERFWIVTNDGKDKDRSMTGRVIGLLEQRGKVCVLCHKDKQNNIIKDKIPENIDCAIVIGGDGSLIEVARVLQPGIPILGVNMGTLGYLTEVEVDDLEEAMEQIINEDYTTEERMMLQGTFENGNTSIALNDIVLTRKGHLRILHFNLYVNGELLNSYEADGMIISTPTGSTAYNLSAGGPIVEPTASSIVVTPICSHSLNTRSIVLSAEDEILIEIGKRRHDQVEEVFIAFDGADTVEMKTGEKIAICKSEKKTTMMHLSRVSFMERLRRKMKGN